MVTFSQSVLEALEHATVPERLAERPATVLERISRGGGATRWFRAQSVQDLRTIADRLAPGSRVSFYFDERIAAHPYEDATVILILDLVATHGDAVVGTMCTDGLEISVEFVAGANELGEVTEGLVPGSTLYVGAFPAADDDQDAVTLTLPDLDGVTRGHPH